MSRSAISRSFAIICPSRNATASVPTRIARSYRYTPIITTPIRRAFASSSRVLAQSDPSAPTVANPTSTAALTHLEAGNIKLEEGDVEAAMKAYELSVEAEETGAGWYNLGVTQYHLKDIPKAIVSWNKAIELAPSTDAHMNIASAYVFSKPSQPALAIQHLKKALEIAPDDPEIAYNLAAILESTNNLQPALQLYQKAVKGGIDRAEQNVRSVAAKIAQALEVTGKDNTGVDKA